MEEQNAVEHKEPSKLQAFWAKARKVLFPIGTYFLNRARK